MAHTSGGHLHRTLEKLDYTLTKPEQRYQVALCMYEGGDYDRALPVIEKHLSKLTTDQANYQQTLNAYEQVLDKKKQYIDLQAGVPVVVRPLLHPAEFEAEMLLSRHNQHYTRTVLYQFSAISRNEKRVLILATTARPATST